MILLQQDAVNTAVFTLAEKSTITAVTASYLFEFINDDTNVSKIFTAPDISTNPSAWNEFQITLTGGTEDLLNGTIDLPTNGYYRYTAYDMTGVTNLDLSGVTGIVEQGKVLVSGVVLPVKTTYEDQPTTKFVYNG